jgi:hypothetical protein
MAKKDFVPRAIGTLLLWLENLKAKIAVHGPALGLDPMQITEIQTKIDTVTGKINTAEQSLETAKADVADRDAGIKEFFEFVRPSVQVLKNSDEYTDEMGEDLGIVGEEDGFNPAAFKTTLKLTNFMGYVQIEFVKGKTDGVKIYARLQGQSEWTYLALDTRSPYIDNRPLAQAGVAETREYIAYGVIDDTQLPTASDIFSIVFPG